MQSLTQMSVKRNKPQTWSELYQEKFIYQISSQYLQKKKNEKTEKS